MRGTIALLAGTLGVFLLAAPARGAAPGTRDEGDIRSRLEAYAPVSLQVDLTTLGPRARQALGKIVVAVKEVDAIYWKQMGPRAGAARLAFADATDPLDLLYRDFIAINYGPFDIRDGNRRFVDVGPPGGRPPGAGFYPEDLTREEFEERIRRYPALEAEFERSNTLIRRVDGTLVAIPYERVYLDELQVAARALREAAALVDSPSLRRYLSLRAEALLEGDFYASDLAWLDVTDNLLDVVIGPIETYDDALLGLKASYEAAALVKDTPGSRSLEIYRRHLEGMSRALPVEERYRRPVSVSGNVLEIVNVVRFGGDFNAGIKTVAASLPNDPRVIQEKGAKKQIYRNVLEAKFDAIVEPIARLFFPGRARSLVTREAFVTNVMLHELAHTFGVDYVADAGDLTVRKALRERYAAIEEAKADVLGLYSLQYLRQQQVLTPDAIREHYATYLAGILRAVRFGTEEAHGLGAAVQLNFLMRERGIEYDARKGEFSIRARKFEPALGRLARELLEIQGSGDYARAGRLLEGLGRLDNATREALNRIEAIPVDVVLTYPL